MLMEFLYSMRQRPELAAALDVLRDFREYESFVESKMIPTEFWTMVDVLEDVLAYQVEGQPMSEDTLALLARSKSGSR